MHITHIILGLLVAVAWGINFVMAKICLVTLSPFMLAASRFILASFPAVFFVKRPHVPFMGILRYGLTMFAIPTLLMLVGIHAGVTAGIASLLMQLQSLLTVVLGIFFFHEKITRWQLLGISFAVLGLSLIGINLDGSITWQGCMLLIAAAASLAIGNVISKKLGKVDMLGLVVWGSFFTWPILTSITLFFDGPEKILTSLSALTYAPIIAVLIIAYVGTLFGFGAWSFLLHHYPISSVAPFTLLVPVIGFLTSKLLLGETLQLWKIGALFCVCTGLAINIINMRYKKHAARKH